MRSKPFGIFVSLAALVGSLTLWTEGSAASNYASLYSFANCCSQSVNPVGAVVFDAAGNLYGTNSWPEGDVYELMPQANGTWTEHMLYTFQGGSDGYSPFAGLVFDNSGNLYGTTTAGGESACSFGCGTVFELMPTSGGGWKERILYRFAGGAGGGSPQAGLTLDAAGNLYGTTTHGGDVSCGSLGCGTVFKLSRTSSAAWTETVLYRFTGRDTGAWPYFGTLVFDRSGNLYGTTAGMDIGGAWEGYGNVFELSQSRDGRWHERVVYEFKGAADSAYPMGGVTLDAAGNLYGTTQGGNFGHHYVACCGTIFELQRSRLGWIKSTLHTFTGPDGQYPLAGVILDKRGNLYATSDGGGAGGYCFSGCGVVYKLVHSQNSWTEIVLHDFGASGDGYTPIGTLTDEKGRLYGTTEWGGSNGYGTVFEIAP